MLSILLNAVLSSLAYFVFFHSQLRCWIIYYAITINELQTQYIQLQLQCLNVAQLEHYIVNKHTVTLQN